MTRPFIDAADIMHEARCLVELIAMSVRRDPDDEEKAISAACHIALEKLDEARSILEHHWSPGCEGGGGSDMTRQEEEADSCKKFVDAILKTNSAGMVKFAEYCVAVGEDEMGRAVLRLADARYREEVQRGDHS